MRSYLHLCSYDTYGAGIAARRLHEAMLAAGIDSRLVVRLQRTSVQGVSRIAESEKAFTRQKRVPAFLHSLMFHTRYCVYSAFATRKPDIVDEVCALAEATDVLVLHWIPYFLSAEDIAEIASRIDAQILWYALDMSPFTGGCHYSWGCESYRTGCEDCPAARFGLAASSIRSNMGIKKRLFESGRVRVIAPNQWVASQAQGLTADENVPVAYIPIPSDVFAPATTRSPAESNNEPFRIFYGYTDFVSKRKGARQFLEAMQHLAGLLAGNTDNDIRPPLVMLPGEGAERTLADKLPFEVEWVARANSDEELAGLYSAADCFVNTSLEDSGPMMVSEALMTGCPVLSFDVGVAPELIRTGSNGYVVPRGDARALAMALKEYMKASFETRLAMSRQARSSVIDKAGNAAAVRAFEHASESSAVDVE